MSGSRRFTRVLPVIVAVPTLALSAQPVARAGAEHDRRAFSTAPAPPAFVADAVARALHRAASSSADRSECIETTRLAAEALQRERVRDTDRPVYLVVLHGTFTYSVAHRPSGAAAPRGHVITMSIDAETGEVLDLGLGDRRPAIETRGRRCATRSSGGSR